MKLVVCFTIGIFWSATWQAFIQALGEGLIYTWASNLKGMIHFVSKYNLAVAILQLNSKRSEDIKVARDDPATANLDPLIRTPVSINPHHNQNEVSNSY